MKRALKTTYGYLMGEEGSVGIEQWRRSCVHIMSSRSSQFSLSG